MKGDMNMDKKKWYEVSFISQTTLYVLSIDWEDVDFNCILPEEFKFKLGNFYYYVENIRKNILKECPQPDFKELRDEKENFTKELNEGYIDFDKLQEFFENWGERKQDERALIFLSRFIDGVMTGIEEEKLINLFSLCCCLTSGKNLEKEIQKEIKEKMSKNAQQRNKTFRDHFKEAQRKAFEKNPKLTANSFAYSFYENPSMKIPYTPQNALQRLIQLAQKNNIEFKKKLKPALADKSQQ